MVEKQEEIACMSQETHVSSFQMCIGFGYTDMTGRCSLSGVVRVEAK